MMFAVSPTFSQEFSILSEISVWSLGWNFLRVTRKWHSDAYVLCFDQATKWQKRSESEQKMKNSARLKPEYSNVIENSVVVGSWNILYTTHKWVLLFLYHNWNFFKTNHWQLEHTTVCTCFLVEAFFQHQNSLVQVLTAFSHDICKVQMEANG